MKRPILQAAWADSRHHHCHLICVSISLFASYLLNQSPEQNLHIEDDCPIIDIPDIELDPSFHLCKIPRLAAKSIHLGPTGYSRLHVMPKGIVRDKRTIFVIVGYGMRSRTDKGHVPFQHI